MVRAASESDIVALARLSGQLGYPATPASIQERLHIIHTRGDGQVLVAERDDAVVGWIHVFGAHTLESPAHAEIGGLVVDELHRCRDIGSQLLEAAERWSASAGYSTVRVRSNVVRERAHRFYQRAGYRLLKQQAVFAKTIDDQDVPAFRS